MRISASDGSQQISSFIRQDEIDILVTKHRFVPLTVDLLLGGPERAARGHSRNQLTIIPRQ
jgi:hypothetical protein